MFELLKSVLMALTLSVSPPASYQAELPKNPALTVATAMQHDVVYVAALLGQSQAAGWDNTLSQLLNPMFPTTTPVERAWVYDKYARNNRRSMDLLDFSRGGEEPILRPLTLGFSGTGSRYPWETMDADPHFGPEMSLAHTWTNSRRGKFVLAKAAFGGTVVADAPNFDDWSPIQINGGESYAEVFLQTYWNPTIEKAIELAGGDRNKVRVLGIIWMQGFSDGRTQEQAELWAENAHATLSHIRNNMGVQSPGTLPIHVFMTAPSPTPGAHPYIPIIRAEQQLLQHDSGDINALSGCEVHDTSQYSLNLNSIPHLDSQGYSDLGHDMALPFVRYAGMPLE